MALDGEVERQLEEMSARIAAIEAAVRMLGGSLPAVPVAPPPPPFTEPGPVSHVLAPGPLPVSASPAKAGSRSSLESRIGGQVLNRVGILAVLVGVAWFLKLAFDQNWIGPGMRVLIGLVCAGGLVGWSERFRKRGFPAFSYSLKALGTSIAYLSLWAAASVFHLAPVWVVFLAMTAVSVANAVLARRQNSELLAMYALSGGLAAPALLAIGAADAVLLFAYLVLLNSGSLFLVAGRAWKRLAWLALLGTAGYYLGWRLFDAHASNIPASALFLFCIFVLFTVMPLVLRLASEERLFFIAFPIVNAYAIWTALGSLLNAKQQALHLGVTVAFALLCLAMARLGRANMMLSRTNLGLCISFVTLACWLQFDDYRLTLCWLVEGLLLVVLARAARENDALRVYAAGVLGVAAAALLVDSITGGSQAVVANMHFVTSLMGAAVFATVAVLSLRAAPDRPGAFCGWKWLAGFAGIWFSVSLVVAVSLEIHRYWYCGAGFFQDLCRPGGHSGIAAGFSLSAWWMVYGAALMTVGFLRQSAFLRWQALGLFALSIGVVFLNGVSLESQGYRVLSFLGLGVLLLAVSFAYQRNWLRLRG